MASASACARASARPRQKSEAMQVFRDLGYQRLWHPVLIRIGTNTTKTFRQASDAPACGWARTTTTSSTSAWVFDGHEGDVGDTFVVGNAPQQQACAEAARTLFHDVAQAWREQGLSGRRAAALPSSAPRRWAGGSTRPPRGIRVGDFPTQSTRAAIWPACPRRHHMICGYWRSRSRIRPNRLARFTKICCQHDPVASG